VLQYLTSKIAEQTKSVVENCTQSLLLHFNYS